MASGIDQAREQRKCREDSDAVETFSKRYYDIFDTRRHVRIDLMAREVG